MVQIVPAILATTATDIAQKILISKDITSDVQVDIVDGSFASPPTWPYTEGNLASAPVLPPFPHSETMNIELDLMIDDPERTLSTWMNVGARRILFHLESTLHMKDIVETLQRDYGYEKGFMTSSLSIGIAVNIETRLELLEPYLDSIDYVQFMGIKRIGVQGQRLNCFERNTPRYRFKWMGLSHSRPLHYSFRLVCNALLLALLYLLHRTSRKRIHNLQHLRCKTVFMRHSATRRVQILKERA
jgi:pentose-5-phosphate-3-epimerase